MTDKRKPRAVLIYFTGAIGDFLLFSTVISNLRAAFPRSRFCLVYRRDPASLLDDFDELEFIDASSQLFLSLHSEDDGLSAELTEFLAGFECKVFVKNDSDGRLAAKFKDDRATYIHKPFPEEGCPVLEHHLSLLDKLKVDRVHTAPVLRNEYREDGPLMIQPGSGSPGKNWPLENFMQLAEKLSTRRPFFLLGPAEVKMIPLLRDYDTIVTEDLKSARRVLGGASLYLGNDSGVSHLAYALGLPACVLLLTKFSAFWQYPTGDRLKLIRTKEISDIKVEDVEAGLRSL